MLGSAARAPWAFVSPPDAVLAPLKYNRKCSVLKFQPTPVSLVQLLSREQTLRAAPGCWECCCHTVLGQKLGPCRE